MLHVAIKKSFPHFTLDVAFTIEKGIAGILGSSGCGKSLTLQCIAGLQSPDEGLIRLNERVFFDSSQKINMKTRYRKIGYMFQNYALFPHLTVSQNIAFGLKGKPREEVEQKVATMIEKIKLNGYEHYYPSQLSGGQQQRVALARTLVTEPDVLLLDEPFSALDHHTKQLLEKEFLLFIKENFAGVVLLVTHNMEEAYRLCDQLILYDEGKVVQVGDKQQVLNEPSNAKAAKIVGCKNVWPLDSVAIDEEISCYVNGAKIMVPRKKERANPRFLGIHSHHIRFVEEQSYNTFDYEIVECVPNMYAHDLTVQTKHFTLHVTVPTNELHAVLSHERKLYLPPDRLFLLS
ncbi:Molybdenum transport system permease protein ModB / Molybdenum transport ATP-binding protein ModC [Anoxybacillus flavithermus]|nr:ATP-binding cassette domain-containing protein [Anoxybacillus flavithermus]OAO78478.1 Molybdenum transport system permease protein ModB / Molybdenum transport ATP-binding protein ModC [Anoxybacillus flavithermus]